MLTLGVQFIDTWSTGKCFANMRLLIRWTSACRKPNDLVRSQYPDAESSLVWRFMSSLDIQMSPNKDNKYTHIFRSSLGLT